MINNSNEKNEEKAQPGETNQNETEKKFEQKNF